MVVLELDRPPVSFESKALPRDYENGEEVKVPRLLVPDRLLDGVPGSFTIGYVDVVTKIKKPLCIRN
jgi:hypothetical protein